MPRIVHIALAVVFCVSIALIGEFWISSVETRIPVASVELLAKEIYTQRGLAVHSKAGEPDGRVLLVRRRFRWADALIPSAITGLIIGAWFTRPKQKEEAEQAVDGNPH